MASIMTNYGSDAWGKLVFGLDTLPSSFYLAVCQDLPDEEADGTLLVEPSGSYARIALARNSGVWGTNSDGLITNLNTITFAVPSGDWGRIGAYALCSASTAGEVYCGGEFARPVYVRSGVPLVLPAGSISFGLVTQADTISV